MTDYFIDDAANGTNDGLSWATCYNTWAQARDSGNLASAANRLIVGADAAISHGANALTLVGPASGVPVVIISSTVGSGTAVAYSKSSTNQIETTGANAITLDGSFALYGICIKSGASVVITTDTNEAMTMDECTLKPGPAGQVTFTTCSGRITNLTVDLDADTGTTAVDIFSALPREINGLSIVNAENRTGQLCNGGLGIVSGADFTQCTGSGFDILAWSTFGHQILSSITNATWSAADIATGASSATSALYAVGPTYVPGYVFHYDGCGIVDASINSIYRTGGQEIGGVPVSWRMRTDYASYASENSPATTPWIYFNVGSTGSKTFDVFITHDANTTYSADFDDSQVWLEVEYLATSNSPKWSLATDHRVISATPTTSPGGVSRDDSSDWNGTGPSFTYKQRLRVAATVNQAGLCRARVLVGASAVGANHHFYIDPKVVVT